MQLEDFEKIKDNLEEEFDNFWNKNILYKELQNPKNEYIVAKENDEIVRICWNFYKC